MKRLIGGEMEIKQNNEHYYFTDSGRSSLKLFIRSGNNNKTYLIPNFLCSVIEKTLIDEKVSFSFYHINQDLSIDFSSIQSKEFDVLYVIHYFGRKISV